MNADPAEGLQPQVQRRDIEKPTSGFGGWGAGGRQPASRRIAP